MRRQTGFTLIEIMLVVVLMSLTAVTVVLNLPDSRQNLAKEQARRFYHRLQLLNEDAILNGQDYGIRLDEDQPAYHFLTLTAEGWQEYSTRFYGDTRLEDTLEWSFVPGGGAWEHSEGLFEPGSLFDEEMFAELKQEQPLKPPQLLVMSSGEITPFRLTIYPQGETEEQGWQIVAKGSGQVMLLAPGEVDESDSRH
jgi:general secretion pathway protein H